MGKCAYLPIHAYTYNDDYIFRILQSSLLKIIFLTPLFGKQLLELTFVWR